MWQSGCSQKYKDTKMQGCFQFNQYEGILYRRNTVRKFLGEKPKKSGKENCCEKYQKIWRRHFLLEMPRNMEKKISLWEIPKNLDKICAQTEFYVWHQPKSWLAKKSILSIKNFTFSCEIFSSRHSQLNFSTNFRSSFDNLWSILMCLQLEKYINVWI